MSERWVSDDGSIELRLGDCREVLADVRPDAIISDPPYSPRQAEGFRSGNDYARKDGLRGSVTNGTITCWQGMPYAPMSPEFARDVAGMFRDVPWFVAFGDHVSFRWWEAALEEAGRYVFAPVVWLRGNGPRFQGDGPCSAAEYICVSRPRGTVRCGSLPGYYYVPPLKGETAETRIVTGQKPEPLMRALIRDYSRPGDLIVDPCAGGATTLVAARVEGRRAIGAEVDPVTYEKAVRRLSRGWTPTLDFGGDHAAE